MFVISGIYKKLYNKISKQIKRQAKNNQKRKDVLKDIHALFIDLEINQQSLEAFSDYKAYASELMDNLDAKPFRRLNPLIVSIFIFSSIVASSAILYQREMAKYLTLNQPVVYIHPTYNTLTWSPISNADYYDIYFDGVLVHSTPDTSYAIPNPGYLNTIHVVVEAKSNSKYNLPSKSESTQIITKNKQTNLYDITYGSKVAYFDQYGNAFVSTAVDISSRYTINISSAFAHDVKVIDKTTDEEIEVRTEGNIKSVYLERLHYYEFQVTRSLYEQSIYFSLDAYETRTSLDNETFTLGPKEEIIIRYNNQTDIRQYYRLTELNPVIAMNTYTGISKENRDIFNANYANTIRFEDGPWATYLVISNMSENEETFTLESITDDVIALEVDQPIVIKDTELTQVFTFQHYGRFEFIYTYGVMDHDMHFFNSNGDNISAYCSGNNAYRSCSLNFSGLVHVYFIKTDVETNNVGISTLEVKNIQD
ncbi:MAG: hypothetical protein RBQ70_01040 [Acholeplasma sp.]|jgi:hypothetical protein|nr:hypothetical protein [Acholeplasma sp.]